MTAWRDLVQARIRERGWSYAEVGRRAGLPRSTVHHLATREHFQRMPEVASLEAMARGLDLPVEVVRDAAAAAAGISVYRERADDDPEITLLIASLERLTADERRHVAALVQSLLQRTSTGDGT